MNQRIEFILNGDKREVEVRTDEILLHVLRDKMGLKSPKCGCERGDCGTCTIMIDDRTVKSCLVLAVEVDGHKVTTLEGLMKDDLTPLQKAFLDKNAFQCGFCAPGMIMAATELLQQNENPTKDEVKEALAGNLCRCTGYAPIIDTVLEVAESSGKGGENE